MAVVKAPYVATAPWAITAVADAVRDALIGAGMMPSWHDSFASGGREHRVLVVTYDAAKTYGKTYYWFTFDGYGIWVRTSTGWNITSHIPSGPAGAGTQHLDWGDTNTTNNNFAHQILTLSVSTDFSITRYTISGRSFFLFRTGTLNSVYTIDPTGTVFRPFYDLDLGYHSGIYRVAINARQVVFNSVIRHRRELFMGSSINFGGSSTTEVSVSSYSIPVNFPGTFIGETMPQAGFVLPGWSAGINPSVTNNFNPVFNGIRLSSIHENDLPTDFGITSIKVSNTMSVQDTAKVSSGEIYELLNIANLGSVDTVTSNPAFVARTT